MTKEEIIDLIKQNLRVFIYSDTGDIQITLMWGIEIINSDHVFLDAPVDGDQEGPQA